MMWNSFALAARLLTNLPALTWLPPSRAEARRAVALFPLVGALIGVIIASVWMIASHVWIRQPLVAGGLALAAGALVTGGRSLGGVGRAADGLAALGAGGDRAHALAVMRDPRRGTAGLVALDVAVALKLAFLSALPPSVAWVGLVLVSALGSWAAAFAYSAFPLASALGRDPETSAGLADAGPSDFLLATVLAIVCAAVLPTRGLLILMAVAIVAAPLAQQVNRRLGGLAPPCCAALGEVAELVALACVALH